VGSFPGVEGSSDRPRAGASLWRNVANLESADNKRLDGLPIRYSARNATIGSTFAARRAGT
jgi:hypothetical protein